jgi:enterochelin esterase-like enzyme
MWATELVPYIDSTYRTVDAREGRAHVGGGFPGYMALYIGFRRPDMAAKVAALSPTTLIFTAQGDQLRQLVPAAAESPMDLFLGWSLYDARLSNQQVDLGGVTRNFKAFLEGRGFTVSGGAAADGLGWSSWRNRTDQMLTALFPANGR